MKIHELLNEKDLISTLAGPLIRPIAKSLEPAAEKQTVKVATKAAKSEKFKHDIATIDAGLTHILSPYKQALVALGIAAPVWEAGREIAKLNEELKAGTIKPEDYEGKVQFYLGQCVAKCVAIGLSGPAVKTLGALIRTLPFGKTAGAFIIKLGSAAAPAMIAYLNTPQGAEAFFQWFAGNMYETMIAEFMRDWVGSWVKKGYDLLTGHEDVRTPVGSNGPNSAMDAISSIPQGDDSNPYGMKFNAGSGKWINPGN